MLSFLFTLFIISNSLVTFACDVNYRVSDKLYLVSEYIKVNFDSYNCSDSLNVKASSSGFVGKLFSSDKKHFVDINALSRSGIKVEPEMYIRVNKFVTTPISLVFDFTSDNNMNLFRSDPIELMVVEDAVQLPTILNFEDSKLDEKVSETTKESLPSKNSIENRHYTQLTSIFAFVFSVAALIMLKYTNAKV